MNRKLALMLMRIVNALLFMLAVVFLLLDALFERYVFMTLYATFFCAAAILLIASSIIDLMRMEKLVKHLEEKDENAGKETDVDTI